jgi:hypothetical protein
LMQYPVLPKPSGQSLCISSACIPLAPLIVTFASCSLTCGLRKPAKRLVRIWRGACATCGYDLTGNVSGHCSECGESVSKSNPHRMRTRSSAAGVTSVARR